MATFVVATVEPEPRVDAALVREFPGDTFRFSDRVHFVSATGSAQDVSQRLGVKARVDGESFDGVTDIVVTKVGPSYYGFSGQDLWDWLRTSLQRDG